MDEINVKAAVRETYGRIAHAPISSGCGCSGDGADAAELARNIGYSQAEVEQIPAGANLGLGCGNPTAIADLKPGETVVDLGSGAGFDCFLAAKTVGERGRVIGIDMTAEMIDKARGNAARGGYPQVEFRLGEIENLPVADSTVDAVISNCVINLAPDKERVFKEALRILKPGGRVMISDIVLVGELNEETKTSKEAYVACVAGASPQEQYLATIKAAGFEGVEIMSTTSGIDLEGAAPNGSTPIASITVKAVKPK